MLEKIGASGYETLSRPRLQTARHVGRMVRRREYPMVAEIGIGIGATTRQLAKVMNNKGELHIFDFEEKVQELKSDLSNLGFTNIVTHGNTAKYWDSYHWSLAKLLDKHKGPIFDYVYLDGAHTILHDLAAFAIIDKLLKPHGVVDLDDYDWTFASSKSMADVRSAYMTEEQERAPQVKFIVDHFLTGNPKYRVLVKNRIFRKRKNRLVWL